MVLPRLSIDEDKRQALLRSHFAPVLESALRAHREAVIQAVKEAGTNDDLWQAKGALVMLDQMIEDLTRPPRQPAT